MGWSPKKVVKSVTKPISKAVKKVTSGSTGAILGVAASPFTGGASLALTGKYALDKLTKTPSGATVDTHTAESIINASEENAKKARARMLATAGGILGEEVDSVQKSGRKIFGN